MVAASTNISPPDGASLPVYSLSQWHSLTAPGGAAYHPGWAPLLTFDLLGSLTHFGLNLLALIAFFERRRSFPRLIISLLLYRILIATVHTIFLAWIHPATGKNGTDPSAELVRSVIGCVIWTTYMLQSRRVSLTFQR